MQIQITSGSTYEVERHLLSGKKVMTRYSGPATVVGIRKGATGRDRNAFVIQIGETFCLASRANFSVLE